MRKGKSASKRANKSVRKYTKHRKGGIKPNKVMLDNVQTLI